MEIEGYTLKELSDLLAIPVNTVKQRLFVAGIKPLTREAIYPKSCLKVISNKEIGRPRKPRPEVSEGPADDEREASALDGAFPFRTNRLVNVIYCGDVAAGFPIEIISDADTPSYPFPDDSLYGGPDNYFCVTARGQSMTAIGIEDGDLLLIRKAETADHNAVALIRYQNESTIKRLRNREGAWFLCWEDGSDSCVKVDSADYRVQGILANVLKNAKLLR